MRRLRIFHQLQAAHSALFRAADHHLRDTLGLGSAQQAILFMLAKEDGLPLGEITQRLHLGKSGLSGLVDRMEKSGLVCRAPNERDRRSVALYLLPQGRALADRSAPITKAINKQLLEPFSADEQETIARFLDHITHNSQAVVASNVRARTSEETSA